MTQEEILNGNKLIAKFMGVEFDEDSFIYDRSFNNSNADNVRYHRDWSWLMPVVEKRSKIAFNHYSIGFEISRCFCCFYKSWDTGEREDIVNIEKDTTLESIYVAVIQFIQWYNTQTK